MKLCWIDATGVDAVIAAGHLFDHDVDRDWVRDFLAEPAHHLCLAYEGDEPVGFVSGVELTHPDKGTEMFLYKLAVDDRFRRRGIGSALVAALVDLARTRGCYGMWVLTEADNSAALATYKSNGPIDQSETVMLTWRLDSAHHTFADDAAHSNNDGS